MERQASSTDADAELLARIRRGEEAAIAVLYDRYSGVVYTVALRVLRDASMAEEVLQEIFMQMWRSPEKFTADGGEIGGWLILAVRHRAVHALRRRPAAEPVEKMRPAFAVNLANPGERSALVEQACGLIEELPPEQRKRLEMAFFDGLTHAEIAEMTGDSPDVVKTGICRALATMGRAIRQ